MRQRRKFWVVLILMTLWLTSKPAYGQETVLVPTSLLRQATARIDSLELRLMFAENRAVERDSTHAGQITYWRGMWLLSEEKAEAWERRANSWWHQNKSAFWVALGALIAALGLK